MAAFTASQEAAETSKPQPAPAPAAASALALPHDFAAQLANRERLLQLPAAPASLAAIFALGLPPRSPVAGRRWLAAEFVSTLRASPRLSVHCRPLVQSFAAGHEAGVKGGTFAAKALGQKVPRSRAGHPVCSGVSPA